MTTPIVFDTEPVTKVSREEPQSAKAAVAAPVVPARQPEPVTLVITSDTPSYRAVADAFTRNWAMPVLTIWLDQEPDTDKLIHALEENPPQAVIAIGEPALAVFEGSALRVIHAQSFQEKSTSRGVDSMPAPTALLRAWIEREPEIRRIGIITGSTFTKQMQSLSMAGQALGLEMNTRLVSSDKEALFEFRRLVPDLDGFIFLPDDSVLSPDVIQEIISHGRSNDIQFLAYNLLMQKLGAQYLVTQDAEDVANGLVQLIREPARRSRALTSFYLNDRTGSQRIDIDG